MAAVVSASLALVVVPGTAAPQGQFGNVVVDTTRDGNDGECTKDCTLREAIAVADTDAGRFVQVPPGVYKLTLGPLVLGNDIVFGVGFGGNQSAGARTTVIDGRGANRVIEVSANSSAVIAGLTISGGGGVTGGGGAFVQPTGELTFFDAIVRDNAATARGGAIDNQGDLALFHTTVTGNRATAGSGGGIAGEENSDTSIFSSTVSGNTASANGGGITVAGSLQLQASTVASNTAAAGGGLYQESTPSAGTLMSNTILGPNGGGSCGGSINGVPRNFTSHNLDADGTCLFASADEGTTGDARLASLGNNGGPTDTMAIGSGSPAINNGDSQLCGTATDQRYAAAVGTCDIGAFEFGGKPPEPTVPPPVAGETVNVKTKSGKVLVKIPGSDEFFDLEDVQQIPVGSTIDTRKGKVTFTAAGKSKAWFYQGLFKFSQKKGNKPLTTLTLTEKLSGCKGGGKANIAKKKVKKRRLWGDGKGRFSTKGKRSAATVVGTKWYVEDRCNGTLTVVKRGVVKVRDFQRRKTVTVRAGHKYFAKG